MELEEAVKETQASLWLSWENHTFFSFFKVRPLVPVAEIAELV